MGSAKVRILSLKMCYICNYETAYWVDFGLFRGWDGGVQ